MIKHGMNVLKKATQYLNPGQVSVIALDAPLYALAKLVQWNYPLTHLCCSLFKARALIW